MAAIVGLTLCNRADVMPPQPNAACKAVDLHFSLEQYGSLKIGCSLAGAQWFTLNGAKRRLSNTAFRAL